MTIYEKIKSLTIDDMAEFLTEYPFGCETCEEDSRSNGIMCDKQCKEHCIEWLNKTSI